MSYKKQTRGSSDSYQKYYKSMDQVMAQKLAFVTSQFPIEGTILDMGSGSGLGSFDLASLFPKAKIVGIDISKESITYSKKNYIKSNLEFLEGDIAKVLFPKNSVDAILNSSVIHHVTSFNGFDKALVKDLVKNQVRQLKDQGILCVRDFVAPSSNELVYLTLQVTDGDSLDDPKTCSTAKLFEIFTKTFKCSLYPNSQISYKTVRDTGSERVYQVELKMANEFLLRKDYRLAWDSELLEEYAYYTREEFESTFKSQGLDILFSKPIFNQWIINHRWKGKIRLTSLTGEDIFLPTNYIIIGRKTERKAISFKKVPLKNPSFLKKETFKGDDGKIWELISRENQTVDLIPYFIDELGELMVLCREGYPRPIIKTTPLQRLDQAKVSEYIIEPVSFVISSGENKDAVRSQLARRMGLNIKSITSGLEYFPSPGGTGEVVKSFFLEIDKDDKLEQTNLSGFSDCGVVKVQSAQQLIRSFQTGAMSDSRLEINLYKLMESLNIKLDPWIEEKIPMESLFLNEPTKFKLKNNKVFKVKKEQFNYLNHQSFEFSDGNKKVYLEAVSLNNKTLNTVSVVPVTKTSSGELLVGLEKRRFPVVERYKKGSEVLVNPAWRIPPEYGAHSFYRFIKEKLQEMGCVVVDMLPLGGNYYPSCALSAENVTPLVAIVSPSEEFIWVPLKSLDASKIYDGHLLTIISRLKHQIL